ncbi:probable LRR receptor-like serine/threonine-protein kinase At3g47570 [Pistacia vera]|uniref:probable LRR receptor-like serine/threonine-protein kinase At3g47570 n=1 Tax=Pistacia vera TaxID=55513 RepID=UPI00126360F3|nr:probable LRR receptor-like serine/threonine-protein kinase At3g47570 [Pistacia vera]
MNTLIQFQSVFLFCITVIQFTTFVNSELAENETDRVALQAFKSKIIHDPQGGNNLVGKLPPEFVSLRNIKSLNVFHNNLTGGIPHFLGNLTSLEKLNLAVNAFGGNIPDSLGRLKNLTSLGLGENNLSGAVPSSIYNLSFLVNFSLVLNQLHGSLPPNLGLAFPRLKYFQVSHNLFSGSIPVSLSNASELEHFQLNSNDFSGKLSVDFGGLQHFALLNVATNKLGSGEARNQLIGTIPPNIGNLKVLSAFDVSDNNLSGEIPSQLSLCSSLEYLYIEGNFFQGFIPSSLSSLRGIRDIDLSRNNLSGQIPKFLATLALENLNLSFNNLEGEVPTKGIFANASAISIVGNSNRLCGGIAELHLPKCINNESKKEKISQLSKILISTVSIFSGLVMMSFFIFCWLKKRRGKQPSESESTLIRELLNLSYEKLLKATDGFSSTQLIGVGSFGSVYKGIFNQDGTIVAVKVLNLQRQGASKSFLAECKALRNIRHRNLVKVITSCSSIDFQGNDFKALVYEYMPNGSLEKWLHFTPKTEEEQPEIQNLTLLQRINIAIDVASAIDYLHHHCHEPILHCDLKPGNVLLDDNMTAHVGDFGLAKFLPEVSNPNKSSSVEVRGTIGYAAPEFGLGSELSTNGDVYSYGILLLEMVTSKKPTDPIFEGDFNLHNFVRIALPDRVMDIVDPLLLNDEEEVSGTRHRLRETRNNIKKECFNIMVRIGVACSMESPQDRMNIRDVVNELKSAKNILLKLNRQEEYGLGNEVSTYGDVYSYGILLLEMAVSTFYDSLWKRV